MYFGFLWSSVACVLSVMVCLVVLVMSVVAAMFYECGFSLASILQSNLNSSNTDGSFTMYNSNSFLSPYEILPIAQENKYSGNFSYFIMKL